MDKQKQRSGSAFIKFSFFTSTLQESQNSQSDLFSQEVGALPALPTSREGQMVPAAAGTSTPAPDVMGILAEILKEQKKLREEVNRLNGALAVAQKVTAVEGSTIEEKFSVKPWINFQDPDIQCMAQDLIKKAGWSRSTPHSVSVLASFGSKKFTHNYRNQIRSKLMGNKEVDVEGLTLKSLHNYLWKCFLPPHVPVHDQERHHLTLMLRSFCGAEKLFRKGGTDGFSFWKEFEKFYTVVVNNTRVDKWDRLEEKEERRIKKYLDNSV
uniref:Uncharacterized protein LOC111111307 isoform X2 n=1 Tax=Crassostrea virginica TaxID=6565 RepID=A0A8B8BKP6_CRAVI|nr:uncharacterized protein LOC111111307 isoform X2 [Crassostrea virginica]